MWGAALAARQYPLAFKQAGVRIALVSASGSSIYGLGAPPDAPQGWPITIRTPRDPSGVATHVVLKNMSLSTSGSYEKFVEESEGTHRSDTFAEAGIEDRYYRFLSEFWRLAASVPERIRFVREIDSARQLVLRPDAEGRHRCRRRPVPRALRVFQRLWRR